MPLLPIANPGCGGFIAGGYWKDCSRSKSKERKKSNGVKEKWQVASGIWTVVLRVGAPVAWGPRIIDTVVATLRIIAPIGLAVYRYQWVLSHVNICVNEIVNCLACEGSHKDSTLEGCLTFSEIATRVKLDISSSWKKAPYMSGMKGTVLMLLLLGTGSRQDETTPAILRSGHTVAQWHVTSLKVYPHSNCIVIQTAPAHIMASCSQVWLQFFIV
ncbi:hypothetical protein TNCV_999861 [Trichonephila clavipes]|nr:hypothetical protein TNCV_999861 [Trichonephila clavipes]